MPLSALYPLHIDRKLGFTLIVFPNSPKVILLAITIFLLLVNMPYHNLLYKFINMSSGLQVYSSTSSLSNLKYVQKGSVKHKTQQEADQYSDLPFLVCYESKWCITLCIGRYRYRALNLQIPENSFPSL